MSDSDLESLHSVHSLNSSNARDLGLGVSESSKIQRVKSVSSLHPDASSLDPQEYNAFTEEQLYPNMSRNQIELQRTQTRATIITALSGRITSQAADIESQTGSKDEETYSETPQIRDEDGLPTENDGVEFQEIDPELVTWDGDDDPQNPRNWPDKKKWRSVSIAALYTLLSPFASTMLSPAMSAINADFGNTKVSVSGLMVSIFVLAWALFSPLIAPLSEMYGRKVVLDASVWFMVCFNIGCALSQNTAQMCVFRLLAGLGGCAPISIGAGVIGDCFDNKERGRAMAVYTLGPTLGPCLSALISGFIVQGASWRWCFGVLCILNGAVGVLGLLVLQETYAPELLKRKARKLRKLTGNKNLHSIYEIATGETIAEKFYLNLTRPVSLLFTNPIVFGLGSLMAVAYGCLYILIVSFPLNWGDNYGFNTGIQGLMYVTFLIGYMLSLVVTQNTADRIYVMLIKKNGGVAKPEFRVPFVITSGIILPAALVWYGWGAEKHLHWMFPAVGAAMFSFGVIPVFYCIQNYLIDMNPRFAASAIAAASVFRSFFGFAFPLFCEQMFENIGYGWGCSIFAFIMFGLGVPFPFFVSLYGERLRIWANKRTERQQAKRDAMYLARLQKKEKAQMDQLKEKAA